jgi:hypothetical protein
MKKYLIIGLILGLIILLLLAGRFGYRKYQDSRFTYPESQGVDVGQDLPNSVPEDNPSLNQKTDRESQENNSVAEPEPKPDDQQLSKILLDVPFTPQAPFANWDEIHEETCEEAAVLMAVFALDGKELNPQLAEDELLKLIEWQKSQFGYFEDTNAAQTAKIVTEYYGKKADIVYDFTTDDIKQALVNKKPVVVLAAGRLLGNPFYKRPGPIYHALVIRGFDGDTLITNDPGTRRGERFTYPSSVILNASHEWVGDPEKILDGRKAMIIVSD